MARIILTSYTATRSGAFVSLNLGLGQEPPFPRRTVEIKTAADCVAAFEAYKVEAAASGLPLALSIMMARGDRKPPGFNKLKAATLYETVNL